MSCTLKFSPARKGALLAMVLGVIAPLAPAHADESGAMDFRAENDAAMTVMMRGMSGAPSGNVDRDFATMMIAHHQGAVDMAVAELRHGSNERLRRLAQGIIIEQRQEITAMQMVLDQELLPRRATPVPPPTSPASVFSPAHIARAHIP